MRTVLPTTVTYESTVGGEPLHGKPPGREKDAYFRCDTGNTTAGTGLHETKETLELASLDVGGPHRRRPAQGEVAEWSKAPVC